MDNKRGQGLSTSAIVLIILGIIVLVILVLGFTIGWNRLLPFVSSNNIDNIKTSCSTACATNNQYDYCSLQRDINDGVRDKFSETCYNLANGNDADGSPYSARNYGIETCPTITCNS